MFQKQLSCIRERPLDEFDNKIVGYELTSEVHDICFVSSLCVNDGDVYGSRTAPVRVCVGHLVNVVNVNQLCLLPPFSSHKSIYNLFYSSSRGAAYMRQWSRQRLFGAKPLPEPMLANCQLETYEQNSTLCESK